MYSTMSAAWSIDVIAIAFILAAGFTLGGYIDSRLRGGHGGFCFGMMPGAAGLAVAMLALAVWSVPASRPWSLVPAYMSCVASAGMVSMLGLGWLAVLAKKSLGSACFLAARVLY